MTMQENTLPDFVTTKSRRKRTKVAFLVLDILNQNTRIAEGFVDFDNGAQRRKFGKQAASWIEAGYSVTTMAADVRNSLIGKANRS